jgi:hypothetical protein
MQKSGHSSINLFNKEGYTEKGTSKINCSKQRINNMNYYEASYHIFIYICMLVHQKGTTLELVAICCFDNDIPYLYLHINCVNANHLNTEKIL